MGIFMPSSSLRGPASWARSSSTAECRRLRSSLSSSPFEDGSRLANLVERHRDLRALYIQFDRGVGCGLDGSVDPVAVVEQPVPGLDRDLVSDRTGEVLAPAEVPLEPRGGHFERVLAGDRIFEVETA